MPRRISVKSKPITVARGDDEWEIVLRFEGSYHPATRNGPEEWPDPFVDHATRNGTVIRPDDVPEDVMEEAVAIDAESEPEDDREYDEDEDEPREREGDERDQPCRDSGLPSLEQISEWERLR